MSYFPFRTSVWSSITRRNSFKSLAKASCIQNHAYPVDTGRKLNVHKAFRRRPGRLLNVLCTFNLCPMDTGLCLSEVAKRNNDWLFELWNQPHNLWTKTHSCWLIREDWFIEIQTDCFIQVLEIVWYLLKKFFKENLFCPACIYLPIYKIFKLD